VLTLPDLRKRLLLMADLVEAYSDFLSKISEIEKQGLPLSRISDREYWADLEKIYTELPKEAFMALMGIWYELGRLSTINITSLSAEEKMKLANDMKEHARGIKEVLAR
jgi:hypothetical protein